MLAKTLVDEIDRLLKQGDMSQRKIAAVLRVSRGTVSAIAQGRRGLYGQETGDDESATRPKSPPARCPSCGYQVYMPCLICRTRNFQERQLIERLVATILPAPVTVAADAKTPSDLITEQGNELADRSEANLLVSPSPCLPLLPPFATEVQVLTLIPAMILNSA